MPSYIRKPIIRSLKSLHLVLIGIFASLSVSVASAEPQIVQVADGYYQYNVAPLAEAGGGLVSFGSGILSDNNVIDMASWPATGKGPVAPSVVFDLRRDVPLRSVRIHARFPNKYWCMSSIVVEARASNENLYRAVGQIDNPGSLWSSLTIDADGADARYIRLKIRRPHTYFSVGVSEVQIFADESSLPLQPVSGLAAEFVRAAEELPDSAVYKYLDAPSQEPGAGDVSFKTGKLTDNDAYDLVAWPGGASASTLIPIVMDLRRETSIQRLTIDTRFINKYWAIKSIEVEVRGTSDDLYQSVGLVREPESGNPHLSIPLDGIVARFVRLKIRRAHPYINVGLAEVRVLTAPTTLPLQPVAELAAEFARGTEELVTTGYYRYGLAPTQEPFVGRDILFSSGKLMNGSDGLVSWPANSSGDPAIPIVMDFKRDTAMQRLAIYAAQFANVESIKVETRPEGQALFRTLARVSPSDPVATQLIIPLQGNVARFMRITVTRKDGQSPLNFSELQLFASPSSLPLKALGDLGKEFARMSEEPVGRGYYRYRNAPVQEPVIEYEIPFANGKLMDGNLNLLNWEGGASAAASVTVIFDLLQDMPVHRIKVHARIPNQYWELQSIKVETRSSSSAAYERPRAVYPSGSDWASQEVATDGITARFVRVTFTRANTFLSLGIGEVEIFTTSDVQTDGDAAQAPLSLAAEFNRDALLVDKYGQFLWTTWAGKVSKDSQLVLEKDAEAATLPTIAPSGADQYGGLIGTPYPSNGYFSLQKIENRWWFITPQGNKFYLNGLCDTTPVAWNYGTSVNKKDGVSSRGVFEELPSETEYPFAYNILSGYPRVNFLAVNLYKKYGTGYLAKWASVLQRRMWDWGFNAHGKWEKLPSGTLALPFIANLQPASNTIRIEWACDPFEPSFASRVEQGIKGTLGSNATNKWMIGFSFESESGWDLGIVSAVMKLDANRQAKIELVDHLFRENTTDALSAAFGFSVTTKERLLNASVSLPAALGSSGLSFIKQVAGPKYWSIVRSVARKYDGNHLFLGGATVPGWRSSFEWETAALPFVDAISLDVYSKSTDWYAEKGYAGLAKPVLILEHGLVSNTNGRRATPGVTCDTHAERGLYYRHVVENLAGYSNFVGASYYSLYDQALTGRTEGGDGENFDFGLLNQQDQPYADMIEQVKKTRFPRLYNVHQGAEQPFSIAP